MRRVITSGQSARLLADCACFSSRPSVVTSQATTIRCISTSSQTTRPRVSEQRPAAVSYNNANQTRSYKKKRREAFQPRNGQVDEYIPETDPDLDLPELGIPIDIKAPGRLRLAPAPDKIDDATYLPANHAKEIEEVTPVAEWWEKDEHWSPSLAYVGFGRREAITDAAVLEALTRRAVVETLAVREVEGEKALAGTWITGGRQALLKALEVDVVVGEDGAVSLKGDVQAVVQGLKPSTEQEAVTSDEEIHSDVLPSEEAHELRKSWDKSWKTISIEEPRFKFALNKRIQQLTGHIIPDAKLLTVRSVGTYLSVLVKPPPPKKLAEVIELKGELPSMPNVKVYPRRVTPIDKEKMVGRWKVILQELEKRDLPVIGTAGYDKSPELKWAGKKANEPTFPKRRR